MMELEVDYKVVELEYGFDNYMKNLFNKSEQIVIKQRKKVDVNKNIIVLGIFDKELNYEKYREIRNKIYIAFNQVRNEFALAKFNQSTQEIIDSDKESDNEKWMEINKIFPIRYTETVKEK